jgi:uncharacterized metal-binding protein YceD (DUF177 family)
MLEVNLFKCTEEQQQYNFALNLQEVALHLNHVMHTSQPQENLIVDIQGDIEKNPHTNKRTRTLNIKIKGCVHLLCQRCEHAILHTLNVENKLEVFTSEEQLENIAILDEAYDSIIASETFDMHAFAEEELLLSLPAYPVHDLCPAHDYIAPVDNIESPFAVLKSFKL